MWSDPFWGKPFGALSEEREQKAVIGTDWENRTVPKLLPLARNLDLFSVFRRTAKGALSTQPRWGNYRQAVVKLKKYAHERLVFTAYLKAPEYRGKKITVNELKRGLRLSGKLDIHHESRHGLVIGGRLRNKPLKTKFTTTGKNMVRDGAYICEHETQGSGIFLTLTFPGGTEQGYETMALASGYCVDRVNRFLRYRVHKGIFSYVWELQKRGAPHLHYIFRLPVGADQDKFHREIKALWYRVLCDVSEDTKVDLFERKEGGTWLNHPEVLQVDIKPIHETYSKYLSKYISKTSTKDGKKTTWAPGRWWGVSSACRRAIYAHRLESVIPIHYAPGTFEYIRKWVSTIGDLVQDTFSFARVPGGEHDGLSVEPVRGFGSSIYFALQDAIVWGDFSGTMDLLNMSKDWCVMGPNVWRINYHDCS